MFLNTLPGEVVLNTPNYAFQIVCLANSRKLSGRCVAGKVIDGPETGTWVRPVSRRPSAALAEAEQRFINGLSPKLGDILRIPFHAAATHPYQPENHLIDQKFYWSCSGAVDWRHLVRLTDAVAGPLWENRLSGRHGRYDRVAEDRAPELTRDAGSLKLLRVNDLVIKVALEINDYKEPKRRLRGRFSHAGFRYCLMITDPEIERDYLAREDGYYRLGQALVCISLGESFNGHAFKLIAGILPAPRGDATQYQYGVGR